MSQYILYRILLSNSINILLTEEITYLINILISMTSIMKGVTISTTN